MTTQIKRNIHGTQKRYETTSTVHVLERVNDLDPTKEPTHERIQISKTIQALSGKNEELEYREVDGSHSMRLTTSLLE